MGDRRPTQGQAALLAKAGLDPRGWSVRREDGLFLYLVDRGLEGRQAVTVSKETGKIVDI